MQKPATLKALEELGRVRLSASFFMREFLYSEIANFHGMPNIPDDPDLAIKAGTRLCQDLLEPIQETFGRIAVRSAYRSPTVNKFGNDNKLNCASNEKNYAGHLGPSRRRRLHGRHRLHRRPVGRRPGKRRLALARLVDPRPFALFEHGVLSEAPSLQSSVARTPKTHYQGRLSTASGLSDEARDVEPRGQPCRVV